MKTCNKCGVQKDELDFRKHRLGCRICERIMTEEVREKKNKLSRERMQKIRQTPEGREILAEQQKRHREKPEVKEENAKKARQYRLDHLEEARAADRRCATKRRQFINLLKMERPCYDCGGMFPPEATDWDHLPGTEKLFCVGPEMSSYSLEKVIDEISKCQLVCASCHRIRTAKRKRERKGS